MSIAPIHARHLLLILAAVASATHYVDTFPCEWDVSPGPSDNETSFACYSIPSDGTAAISVISSSTMHDLHISLSPSGEEAFSCLGRTDCTFSRRSVLSDTISGRMVAGTRLRVLVYKRGGGEDDDDDVTTTTVKKYPCLWAHSVAVKKSVVHRCTDVPYDAVVPILLSIRPPFTMPRHIDRNPGEKGVSSGIFSVTPSTACTTLQPCIEHFDAKVEPMSWIGEMTLTIFNEQPNRNISSPLDVLYAVGPFDAMTSSASTTFLPMVVMATTILLFLFSTAFA
ncbi:MAG: hypothetical protein WC483_01115 [Candidatus Paceibacterota bacterium]